MRLVFILLGIFILLVFIFTILLLSTVQIQIKNFKIANKKNEKEKRIKAPYEIKILLNFLEKIPILKINLNNMEIRKIYNSEQLQKIDFEKVKQNFPSSKEIIQMLKKIKIKNLKLKIDIGTEDAILTSYLTAIIASIIGILLPHITTLKTIKNCNYIVNPKYENKNEYHIYFDCIIQIKIVHIIYSMLNFEKKGRNKYERTSNRRSYAYRYE